MNGVWLGFADDPRAFDEANRVPPAWIRLSCHVLAAQTGRSARRAVDAAGGHRLPRVARASGHTRSAGRGVSFPMSSSVRSACFRTAGSDASQSACALAHSRAPRFAVKSAHARFRQGQKRSPRHADPRHSAPSLPRLCSSRHARLRRRARLGFRVCVRLHRRLPLAIQSGMIVRPQTRSSRRTLTSAHRSNSP